MLQSFIRSHEQVDEHSDSFDRFINEERAKNTVKDRKCERCERKYKVEMDRDGNPKPLKKNKQCKYHPGRLRYNNYDDQDYYSCCNATGSRSDNSCKSHNFHVSEYPGFFNKSEFVSTTERSGTNKAVYALDCEMCVTINGYECCRVSVVKEDYSIAYETLVRPDDEIIDYVFNYSGITKEILEQGPSKSLKDVQNDLLELIKEDTILIGHSIGNDLKSLKLSHNKLVDTVIAFPYNSFKRNSLRWLARKYLYERIQIGYGHDSAVDARTCMKLMQVKVGLYIDTRLLGWDELYKKPEVLHHDDDADETETRSKPDKDGGQSSEGQVGAEHREAEDHRGGDQQRPVGRGIKKPEPFVKDDIQLYINCKPEELECAIAVMNNILCDVVAWSETHGLKLNPRKTQRAFIVNRIGSGEFSEILKTCGNRLIV
ncbi:Hypothetical predicted protein [Cloeon dipterum]|nr:Hypothetical predicted protein [Cloeon dipterum]